MAVIEGRTWLEIISPVDCERHLREETIGRVGVVVDGHPEIFPVTYAVDDTRAIVFRTDQGTKLSALAHSDTVAFEVDGFDQVRRIGWSVLVVGTAQRVSNVDELVAMRHLKLEPWGVGEKANYVRITPSKVSGRKIHVGRTEP